MDDIDHGGARQQQYGGTPNTSTHAGCPAFGLWVLARMGGRWQSASHIFAHLRCHIQFTSCSQPQAFSQLKRMLRQSCSSTKWLSKWNARTRFTVHFKYVNTTEALKMAMQALRDADIPDSLWETALPLALADIRGAMSVLGSSPRGQSTVSRASRPRQRRRSASSTKARDSGAAMASTANGNQESILSAIPDEQVVFKRAEAETGVSAADLGDIFHIEAGRLQIKVPSRQLGSSGKAATTTIAALLAGVVFAGTDYRKLSFKEVNGVCKAKNVYDGANSSAYIKTTSGFAALGLAKVQYLTTKTGWQVEFAHAANRVLNNQRRPA